MSDTPTPSERLAQPEAVLTTSDLAELGYSRRAVASILHACPVQLWEGYARPLVRVADFLEWRERSTYRDGDRVR